MTDYDIHRPSFSDTTRTQWDFPTEDSFDTDDLSAVADHFLLSASGFGDPDAFDDLALPVVNTQGYLSLNGLWVARSGPYSVERVECDEETKEKVRERIDDLGNENFEEFRDVTVTKREWEETTGSGRANPLGGVVNDVVDPAQPSYSPQRATIGLLFLVGVAIIRKLIR